MVIIKHLLISAVIILALQTIAMAQKTTWLSPSNFYPTDSNITINPSISPNTAIAVRSSITGESWINLGLNLSTDQEIDSILVCYQLTNASSYITQIRLLRMTTPDAAYISLDDGTDLTSTTPATYSTPTGGLSVNGAITLSLRVNFTDTDDIIEIGGIGVVSTETVTASEELPEIKILNDFRVNQNFPNPFNPSTTITYSVPENANVLINIYNSNGELIRTLSNEEQTAGNHSILWNGRNDIGSMVASGTYFYQVISGEFAQAKKMILLK